MSFTKIKQFILQNKKSLLFLVFLISFLFPNFAFAADDKNIFIQVIDAFTWIAWVLIWLATQFVWLFLTPWWTSGDAIWFNGNLKELWILMSNVVYTIFALILIVIALMNIIWKWENTWELKQALPKFIVWVLIVPFSWFMVSALIWLSSILTTSVLSIPTDTFKDTLNRSWFDKVEIYTKYDFNLTSKSWSTAIKWIDSSKQTLKAFIEDWDNIFSIMTLYTYWIMSVDANWKLFQKDTTWWKIENLADLSAKLVFDLIFFVVFFILLIALLMALFVRGIYIWIFTVMSPLFGLLYFFWDKTPEALKNFTFWKFLGLVMMPVYVAAALSFGLLFISVAWESLTNENCNPKNQLCVTNGTSSNWEEIDNATVEFSWITLNFKWSFWAAWKDLSETLGKLKWTFWDLILKIFWLVVMWIAIMAALKSSELTAEVIKPIELFWDSIWQLAMKAPSYAPIIPAPGWWTMSASALWSFGSTTAWNLDAHFIWKWSKLSTDLFGEWSPLIKAMNKIALRSDWKTISDKWIIENTLVPGINELRNTTNSSEYDRMVAMFKKEWIVSDKFDVSFWDRNNPIFIKEMVSNNWLNKNIQKVAWINGNQIELNSLLGSVNKDKGTNKEPWTSTNTFNINMPQTLDKTKIFKDWDYNKWVTWTDYDSLKNGINNISDISLIDFEKKIKEELNKKWIKNSDEQDAIYNALVSSFGSSNFKTN